MNWIGIGIEKNWKPIPKNWIELVFLYNQFQRIELNWFLCKTNSLELNWIGFFWNPEKLELNWIGFFNISNNIWIWFWNWFFQRGKIVCFLLCSIQSQGGSSVNKHKNCFMNRIDKKLHLELKLELIFFWELVGIGRNWIELNWFFGAGKELELKFGYFLRIGWNWNWIELNWFCAIGKELELKFWDFLRIGWNWNWIELVFRNWLTTLHELYHH